MTARFVLVAALLTAPALAAAVREEPVAIAAAGCWSQCASVLPPGWSPGAAARLMVFLHNGFGSQHSLHRRGLAETALA
jgi:hypothetical protein